MRRKGFRQRELEDAKWLAAQQIGAFDPPPRDQSVSTLAEVPAFCTQCNKGMTLESGWTILRRLASAETVALSCGNCGHAVHVDPLTADRLAEQIRSHFAAKVAAMARPEPKMKRARGGG